MQHESTPPFRFRSPAGWPTPSPEWAELHQAAEPAPGWTPAPGIPAAPAKWRFWVPAPRAFRAYLPPLARRLRVLQWVGLAVALASLAAVLVVAALGGPAVLALAPLVAGVAVLVVSSWRHGDLAARTALSVRDDAAAWRRSELPARARAARPDVDDASAVAAWEAAAWGLPTANPFVEAAHTAPPAQSTPPSFRRWNRAVLGVTAGVAACVLVIGASAAVAPVVRTVQEQGSLTLAHGLQDDDPDEAAPDADEADPNPWTSDDGTITVSFLSDEDTWQATCGAIDFADGCWAWQIDGECDGPAVVTVGFSATEGGTDSRTDTRTVLLTSGTPLVLTEQGSEEWSSIVDVTCSAPPKSPVALTKTQLDSDDQDEDGSWPDGCVDWGCAGWELTPQADCPSATVQFSIDEEIAELPDPHDVVVATPLHAGEPVDVWAGGAWSSDHDATLAQVTCG
ncbi:hypothetical protein ACRQ4B_06035 [Curtobacterium sp. SP.BCo]|uniref:hypothetical protein n=1 Tax=Curtobacterium sp. SP.BCo TaxID=3435229 RepID=UPI003F740C38